MMTMNMLANKLASVAAVINDGQYMWAVDRAQAEAWAQANLGRQLRSTERWGEGMEAKFCRDVPAVVDWITGGPEMIALCRALVRKGAPMHMIDHLPEQEDA